MVRAILLQTIMLTLLASHTLRAQNVEKLIVSQNSGKCLDVFGWSVANGVGIVQWDCHGGANQRWTFRLRSPLGSDEYVEVHSVNSSKCLDVNHGLRDDGIAVQQWGCHNAGNQKWFIAARGNAGGEPLFEIMSEASRKCLGVAADQLGNGTMVTQWTCDSPTAGQRWRLVDP